MIEPENGFEQTAGAAAAPASAEAPAAQPQAEEAPKPRRGRPRKAKADADFQAPVEAQAPTAEGEPEAPKPRRGRPKKSESEKPAAEKAEAARSADVADAAAAAVAEPTEEAPKPRRRTRSKNQSKPADQPASPESAPAAVEETGQNKAERAASPESEFQPKASRSPKAERASRAPRSKKADPKKASQDPASAESQPSASPNRTESAEEYIPLYARAERALRAAEAAGEQPRKFESTRAHRLRSAESAETPASGKAESQGGYRDGESSRSDHRHQQDGGKKRGKNQRQKRDRDRDRDRDRHRGDRDRGNDRSNDNHRKQRRQHQANNQNREPVVPKTTAEDLAKLKVVELRQKAEELGLSHKGLLKADLVAAVLEASIKKEGFVEVQGILDILTDGFGFLRTGGYLPSENDVYVGASVIRRNGLRKGDLVKGQIRPKRDNEKFAAIQRIDTVNGVPLEEVGKRPRFADLTPVYPDERLLMEHGKSAITARVIDLAAPIGKGQRGLIVSPPKAGKTTVLKDIAASISQNNPEVHLICLLVDERPEEVTDMQRSIKGEVVSSTFDMPSENHIAVAEMVIERAKRLVENGQDVVILLDSITRLARAYNLAQPASGRILSGGVDSTALYPPKRFLGAARNIEGGGSLTILASALIDTGSKMDEVIFEEFKGTGNMELKLDRYLADRRIFPAIDPVSSGTRKEELLLDPQEAPLIWAVRRILSNMNNTERAMDMLIKSLKQTDNNQAFLLRTAKKAQMQHGSDHMEL